MKKLDAEWFLFWGGFFILWGGLYNEMRAQRGEQQQQQQNQQKSLSTISTFRDTENLTGEDAEYAALAWPALSRRSE